MSEAALQTAIIELAYPPPELSPNARAHWALRAGVTKKYRLDAAYAAFGAGVRGATFGDKIDLHVSIIHPDRRKRDLDGVISRLKSGFDGIADALKRDDHSFRLHFDVADEPCKGGKILVSIS